MATDIKAPTFPESVAEGTVAAWHKKPGDSVERDELIVEIETDKVVLEVVAPEAGTLTDVMAEEGDTVQSEQVLGKIGEGSASGDSGKKHESASEAPKETASEKPASSGNG
ncbi:dihydrolipoamide succinyltransferase, partial [Leclercia adecarboxylata]|uniref:biotin/lipoyl-containing protein n=1 Tax=Leclercia adecarboxylata TaxID=83655 RepID=UPI00236F6180